MVEAEVAQLREKGRNNFCLFFFGKILETPLEIFLFSFNT